MIRILSATITVTLLLAATTNAPAAWALQILVDIAALAYFGLWAWLRTVRVEQAETVRADEGQQRLGERLDRPLEAGDQEGFREQGVSFGCGVRRQRGNRQQATCGRSVRP